MSNLAINDFNDPTRTHLENYELLCKEIAGYEARLKEETDNSERRSMIDALSVLKDLRRHNAPGAYEQLHQRVAELEYRLKPFADAAKHISDVADEDIALCLLHEDGTPFPIEIDKSGLMWLEIRDLRAARDALKGKTE